MLTICSNKTQHDVLTLTPNSRLSRFLIRDVQDMSHKDKNFVCNSPQILPLQSWLETLYQACLFHTNIPLTLLSDKQEAYIWQTIIEHSAYGNELLDINATIKTAQQAYSMLKAWDLNIESLKNEINLDVKAFHSWACEFCNYCQENHLLSKADLIDWLIPSIEKHDSILPQNIVLYHFDEITPQVEKLFSYLKSINITIEHEEHTNTPLSCHKIACEDLREEIQIMARWAKAAYENEPQQKITCIVPNLSQLRPLIIDTFQEVFFPEAIFNPEFKQAIVNISGGYPLNEAAIIYAALKLLALNTFKLPYQELTFLLSTPFLVGFNDEMLNRASFDAKIRDYDNPELSWKFIMARLSKEADNSLPSFVKNITQWQHKRKQLIHKQTLSLWKNDFYHLLEAVGWPGERSLNSEEYQQVQRWYEVLNEFVSTDLDNTQYTFTQALKRLSRLTHDTLFETQSHDGPVQVLGLLEAAGSMSKQCWVMHMDDASWPQAASPNPLLPYTLQRKYNMPHSSPARELEFSQSMMQRLQNSTQHIVYSYHRHDADRKLSPSPLLKNIPHIELNDLVIAKFKSIANVINEASNNEFIEDELAPPIQKNEKTPGGTGIFKQQASCPFRAFAQYRLHAQGLVNPESGLNALERGILLHSCLNSIWASLKSQEHLLRKNKDELCELVQACIIQAFEECFPKYTHKLKPKFKALETQRLQQLLLSWLEFEKQRPAFKVVAHEQWRRSNVKKLTVNMQIDRIDELATGERIVIDYKSGKTNTANWFGDKPREPQLPLYCISESDVDGIAFAQVRIDEMKFKGISANETDIKGIKEISRVNDYEVPESWNELVRNWKTVINQLADDFFAGDARVAPAFYNSCDYCELHSLCRIAEMDKVAK